MTSAPAHAASTSSNPAVIAHMADCFLAHHMNVDASMAQTAAATMTKTAQQCGSGPPGLSSSTLLPSASTAAFVGSKTQSRRRSTVKGRMTLP